METSAHSRGISKISPKSIDYGSWISPNGIIFPVPYQGHEKEGRNLTHKFYKNEIENCYGSNIEFLFARGWARVVSNTALDADHPLTQQQKDTILEFFKKRDLSKIYVRIPGTHKFIENYENLFNAIMK